jgi:hypothetical protein
MFPVELVKIIFDYSDLMSFSKKIYDDEIVPYSVLNIYISKMFQHGLLKPFDLIGSNPTLTTNCIQQALRELFDLKMIETQYKYVYKLLMSFINYASLECINIRLSGGKITHCRHCKKKFDDDILKVGYNACPKCGEINLHDISPTYYIKLNDYVTIEQLDELLLTCR